MAGPPSQAEIDLAKRDQLLHESACRIEKQLELLGKRMTFIHTQCTNARHAHMALS